MIDIGTWYFDKWSRCYVQVVAGAQKDGYVTVIGYQPPITCAVKITDLNLNRSRRIESMVGPVPVELQENDETFDVTEHAYSWGTVISVYRGNRRIMFVDMYKNGDYRVYDNV
jgi:hypothetical protein